MLGILQYLRLVAVLPLGRSQIEQARVSRDSRYCREGLHMAEDRRHSRWCACVAFWPHPSEHVPARYCGAQRLPYLKVGILTLVSHRPLRNSISPPVLDWLHPALWVIALLEAA